MIRLNGTSECALVPVGDTFAMVNREDLPIVSERTWHVHRAGGIRYARDGHDTLMHHLIVGHPSNGMEVDHINGNGLDNRLCNLRICTVGENQYNRHRHAAWIGVRRRGRRFAAELWYGRRRKYLGSFETPQEAALARDAALDRLVGPFGKRNFPVLIRADEAVRLLRSCDTRFFRVLFRRRADATVRSMLCRCGVRRGTKGLGLAFEPRDRALLPVWDVRLKAHRFVNLLGVLAAVVDGTRLRVGGPRLPPGWLQVEVAAHGR